MSRHLPPPATGIALPKISQGYFVICDSPRQQQRAVTIMTEEIVIFFHRQGQRGNRFMSDSRDLKPATALTQQDTFPTVSFATEVHQFEETKSCAARSGELRLTGGQCEVASVHGRLCRGPSLCPSAITAYAIHRGRTRQISPKSAGVTCRRFALTKGGPGPLVHAGCGGSK